jgi:hypothetical protein
MTMRTTSKTVTFHRPFWLKGVDRLLPPADYRVVTDEELLEGLSFPAYHRVSTVIFVPGPSGSAVEMVTIDPLDLQAAQDQDAAMHTVHGRWQVSVTAPRLDRPDHCRLSLAAAAIPILRKKRAARRQLILGLGRIKRLPMLMSASGTSATYGDSPKRKSQAQFIEHAA